MTFPTEWDYKVKLTSDNTKVASAVKGLAVDLSNMPAGFWSNVHADTNLLKGLINYWKFDGDAIDSVGSNDGTVNGATLTTGKIGQGYAFDGVNDYISYSTSNTLLTDDQTVSLWFNRSATQTGGRYLLGSKTTGDTRYYIWIDGDRIKVTIGADTVDTGVDVTNSTWYNIIVTKTSSNFIVYVNGVNEGNSSYSLSTLSSTFSIGRGEQDGSGFGSSYFNGIIDEVIVWNRALSADEVSQLHTVQDTGESYGQHPFRNDIRITSDEAGTTQVARDVISIDTIGDETIIEGFSDNSSHNFTKNADNLELFSISGSNRTGINFIYDQILDFSNIKTIEVEWMQSQSGQSNLARSFIIASPNRIDSHTDGDIYASNEYSGTWSRRLNSLDVSSITGEGYIKIHTRKSTSLNGESTTSKTYVLKIIYNDDSELVIYDEGDEIRTPPTGLIRFDTSSISTGSDTDYWLWYGNSEATEPSPSDTYGQYNAYDSNIYAYYPGEEQTGTNLGDRSDNSRDGTLQNGANWEADAQLGGGVNFPNTDNSNRVNLGSSFGSGIGTSDVTIIQWLKATDFTSRYRSFYIGNGSTFSNVLSQIAFERASSGSDILVQFRSGSSGAATLNHTPSGGIGNNEKFMISVTRTGTTAKLFYNGVEADSVTDSNVGVSPEGQGWIAQEIDGASSNGGWKGWIDETRVILSNYSENKNLTIYNNESDNESFWTFGPQEEVTGITITTLPASNITFNSAQLNCEIEGVEE